MTNLQFEKIEKLLLANLEELQAIKIILSVVAVFVGVIYAIEMGYLE